MTEQLEHCAACNGDFERFGICVVCGTTGKATKEENQEYLEWKYGNPKPLPEVAKKFIPSWEKEET